MARSPKDWEDLNLTRDEVECMAKAFQDETFKKMFFDYCEEIQDPENRRIYQEELTQLEAERGVDITFINPEPGFVVKTSVDGISKGFVNVAKSEKVARPKSTPHLNHETGKKGLMWSIPLAQAPPRRDLDKKGNQCVVYDVVFHPDALRMAEKNVDFRKHLIETACDGVEREHKVKLDRANLKFPKMAFKGIAQPTVIRKIAKNPPTPQEPSPIDDMMPPIPKANTKPKVFTSTSSKPRSKADEFTTPQFVIKHRRAVDLSEMTYELDAKFNVTIPKDLIVEISLPLLNSTGECNLDVTEKRLYLVSTQPAKYKLNIDLPYPVNDKDGSAKFDKTTRKLTVTLPVVSDEKARTMRDLYREDSGVESDVRDDSGNVSPSPEDSPKIVELPKAIPSERKPKESECAPMEKPFLDPKVQYNLPAFDCNTLDDNLAFTMHVKNVQPDSIEHIRTESSAHVKFSNIGAGFYPVHYAFAVQLPSNSSAVIRSVDVEPWDNNVILSLALDNFGNLKTYLAGVETNDLKDYPITEDFVINTNKFNLLQEKDDLEVSVKPLPTTNHVEIEIKSSQDSLNHTASIEDSNCKKSQASGAGKKHKKKNKKRRSLSESACDEFKLIELPPSGKHAQSTDSATENVETSYEGRKIRSFSESHSHNSPASPCHKDHKGILKRRSRYERSISESCSSYDEHSSYSCSADFVGAGSFDDIPEEGRDEHAGLSESCKKTVRFSDVIKKQLFRLDSSILGQRKKNQKKKTQKLRARQRRVSEGDSIDYDDKSPDPVNHRGGVRKNSKHDSGLDLSLEGKFHEDSQNHSDQDGAKNGFMFDMEI